MKFYIDEQGNRYSVDRETGERTLIQPTAESGNGDSVGGPEETTDETVQED